MNPLATTSRLHYLDAMRSVLMLLGVVLHAARPYDSGDWQVKDGGHLAGLDGVVTGIHLFRMPAFFVVAGFFAMYLLQKQPVAAFIRERLRRVLVPLLATLLTFNLVQVWLVSGNGGRAGFLRGELFPAWLEGDWVSHLWFLAVLAAYFAVVALMATPLRRAAASAWVQAWLAGRWALPVLLAGLVATPLSVAALDNLTGPAVTWVVLGTASADEVLRFAPSFVFGMALYTAPRLLERFGRCDAWTLALGAAGFAVMQLTLGRDEPLYRAIHLLAEALLRWMVIRALFALFQRWVNRPSRVFSYLSSASYSIYLFHHVMVIATAMALMPLALGAGGKFLIVLAVAWGVPLALHHCVVRRYPWAGYLFNGRSAPRPRAATAAAPAPASP